MWDCCSLTLALFIVKCVRDKSGYFAEKIYKSMKGLGTDDHTLIRCIVTRCEVDMVQIKQHFVHNYREPLGKWIEVINTCTPAYLVYLHLIRATRAAITRSCFLHSSAKVPRQSDAFDCLFSLFQLSLVFVIT